MSTKQAVDAVMRELEKKPKIKIGTLAFLTRIDTTTGHKQVLLARHKKQRVLNGIGGKVGDKEGFENETVEEGLKRELKEEIGITIIDYASLGKVKFEFFKPDGQKSEVIIHLFEVTNWDGKITANEGVENPLWYDINNIPWNQLWATDRFWLEPVLVDRKGVLDAVVCMDINGNLLIEDSVLNFS